jgi:hypothetical protein
MKMDWYLTIYATSVSVSDTLNGKPETGNGKRYFRISSERFTEALFLPKQARSSSGSHRATKKELRFNGRLRQRPKTDSVQPPQALLFGQHPAPPGVLSQIRQAPRAFQIHLLEPGS